MSSRCIVANNRTSKQQIYARIRTTFEQKGEHTTTTFATQRFHNINTIQYQHVKNSTANTETFTALRRFHDIMSLKFIENTSNPVLSFKLELHRAVIWRYSGRWRRRWRGWRYRWWHNDMMQIQEGKNSLKSTELVAWCRSRIHWNQQSCDHSIQLLHQPCGFQITSSFNGISKALEFPIYPIQVEILSTLPLSCANHFTIHRSYAY